MSDVTDPGAVDETAAWYARVAGESDGLYAEWASGAADDADLLARIASLPRAQRQPHLLFAVTRLSGAPEEPFAVWRSWVLANWQAVAAASAGRMVQTNEPARCAALLPALGLLDGPLALLEVGASAGLCLYADRYSYRYTRAADPREERRVDPADGVSAVVLEALVSGEMPVPRMPDIRWRAGIDLAPLDVTSETDLAWLDVLVPPEQSVRRDRARAAARIASADPPVLVRGDASELATLAALVSTDATLVIMTVGTVVYLPLAERQRFAASVRELGAHWLSLERSGLVDLAPATAPNAFVLGLDGRALATVSPHGEHLTWL